tara:strand:- start:792 stop:950 length:159 start_codon:yes stop_codon:yes gene_type:complete
MYKLLKKRKGLKIGCPEEVAWRLGWISDKQILKLSFEFDKTEYGKYLKELLI